MFATFRSVCPVLALLCLVAAAAAAGPPSLEQALARAGSNRPQLERVLEHYRTEGDAQKLAAAEFLITNMEGHGYAVHGFFDEAGNEVAFDALVHATGKEAREAFEALEKTHGPLHAARRRFEPDLEKITADLLIDNIDLAFVGWRQSPWASGVSFEVFCEHILPYRCGDEPLEPWRRVCRERLGDVPRALRELKDLTSAGRFVYVRCKDWVRLSDLYDLHPSEQGFAQMLASGRGHSQDMSNVVACALRSSAVVAARDSAPFQGDRENGRAWTAMLDAQGRGVSQLAERAAKVYRRMYSIQPGSLGAIMEESDDVPVALTCRHDRDVTEEYTETTDVAVTLAVPPPGGARFAYICVFTGGRWRPVHWGRIEDLRVTFAKMGRGIAYLPAYHVDDAFVPAGPPLVLSTGGVIEVLDGRGEAFTLAVGPRPRPAAGAAPPMVQAKPGLRYELFVWEDGWRSLGTRDMASEPVAFEAVPANRLYRLVAAGAPRLARTFTVQAGRCTSW